jgi:hypothetical protein
MKRVFIYTSIFLITLLTGTVLFFYIQRGSRPTVLCASLDDSIRPRDHCLMNPFRDKQPEEMAEKVLEELKNGNMDALLPFDAKATEENRNHHRQSENKYKINYWRIGDRRDSANEISVTYWVARENYYFNQDGSDTLESVIFVFTRESNEIKPKSFSAGY